MNNVLFIFLSLSVSGSILALLLLALRPLIKNRLSQTWQYYIWLIVILRFLFPFAPQVSLVGEMARQLEAIAAPSVVAEVSPDAGMGEEYTIPQAPDDFSAALQNGEIDTPAQSAYWREILNNIWLIWIGVALVLFVHKVASYRSFVRFIKVGIEKIDDEHVRDIYQAELTAANIKRNLPLYINKQVVSPMLVGIVRPSLVIPQLKTSNDELRNILRHELTHYKRLDFLYKWLVQITLCIHWFNPLVHLIAKQINRCCELSCDETVIKYLDEDGRLSYGDALIASLKTRGNYSDFVVSMTMSENGNTVKERLDMIMGFKKKSGFMVGVTTLLTVLLLCGFTFVGAYSTTPAINPISETPWNTKTVGTVAVQQVGSLELTEGENIQVDLTWTGTGRIMFLYTMAPDSEQSLFDLIEAERIILPLMLSENKQPDTNGFYAPDASMNFSYRGDERLNFMVAQDANSPVRWLNEAPDSGIHYLYVITYGDNDGNNQINNISGSVIYGNTQIDILS